MSKRYIPFFLILLLFSAFAKAQDSDTRYFAQKGFMDLHDYDFETRLVRLNGEWAFYPGEFIEPDDSLKPSEHYIKVPQLWSKSEIDEVSDGLGYGSYRLKVKVSEHIQVLAIRIRRIETAYRMFFNDSLIAEVGKPGRSRESTRPGKHNHFVFLPVKGKDFTLTVHVSNYHHRKSGIVSKIELGTPQNVTRSVWRARGYEMLLLGAILIMTLYHASLFLFRRDDRSALYFALFLLVVQIHTSVNGEVFLTEIIPDFNWEILLKIDFITNYLTIVFFFLFFRSLNPKMYKRPVIILIVSGSLLLTVITLFTKALFFTNLLIVFEIIGFIAGFYVISVLFVALFKRQRGAVYPLLGTLLMMAAGINDVLYEQMIVHTFYALPLGIVGFIFFQSHILNVNFKRMEEETDEIKHLTGKLDAVKTKFLSKSAFNFEYPLQIISEEIDADYAVMFEAAHNRQKTVAVYPEKFSDKGASGTALRMAQELPDKKELHILTPQNSYNGKASLAYPVKDKDSLKYILYFEKHKAFSKDEIQILNLLTEQILGLSENFRLYAELKELGSRLEEIIEERTREVRDQRENLVQQRDEIEQQAHNLNRIYAQIQKKHKAITADIRYAHKIHSALFKSWKHIPELFPKHFIFFQPKDIIGGDFYWAAQTGDERIFCAADCTGHGVPGALMSIIGHNLLNRAVHEMGISRPDAVLDNLQEGIRKMLSQDKGSKSKDGMDLSLINYNPKTRLLQFAAARNTAYLVRKGELIELPADKISIGGMSHARVAENRRFSLQNIDTQPDDMLYMMSDGYIDQIGGKHRRKFMRKRIKQLFLSLAAEELENQKEQLSGIFNEWRGSIERMDDVLVVGIKF